MKKRNLGIIAAMLALCMVLVMLPAGVYADEGWDGSVDTSWYDTEATAFTINTPAQLAGLAAIVNGTAEGIEKDSFAGKTVTLGADIDLNNKPWTQIGCRTGRVKYDSFSGCFDGCGFEITNLSIICDMGSAYPGSVGLFGHVVGTEDNRVEIKSLKLNGAVQMNTIGTNTPNTPRGFAGLVGIAQYTDVSDCIVSVELINTSTFTGNVFSIGGIVGEAKSVNIVRCANLGNVDSGTNSTYAGGIVGNIATSPFSILDCYNRGNISSVVKGNVGGIAGNVTFNKTMTAYVKNCYNTGIVTGASTGNYVGRDGAIFGNDNASEDGRLFSVENLYYLNTSSANGVGNGTVQTVAKTSEEMMASEFVEALNSNNAWKAGLTYPILVCQPDEVTQVVDGDIDNSGIVDENDLTLLIGHVLGTDPLSDPDQKTAADINGNGYIDENDVSYLIQIILHL